jgi:pimeloyl-ACP methyl ester carboxylesterase
VARHDLRAVGGTGVGHGGIVQEGRFHRVVASDGTELVARVEGRGPPLVLLPAGPGTSEASWRPVLSLLGERFTCYLLDTRGRGTSSDHPDHSPERLAQDVAEFIGSVGQPVGLVEWGTSLWTLVAAQHAPAVTAVAAYEPGADEVMSAEVASLFVDLSFRRMGELVAEGRLVDAARAFLEQSNVLYSETELAHGAPYDFWIAAAPNLPVFLHEQQLLAESEPGPTSPEALASVDVPVLLLKGSASRRWFADSVRHVAAHVMEMRTAEVTDAGHFGPHTHPEAVAEELIHFFATKEPA